MTSIIGCSQLSVRLEITSQAPASMLSLLLSTREPPQKQVSSFTIYQLSPKLSNLASSHQPTNTTFTKVSTDSAPGVGSP